MLNDTYSETKKHMNLAVKKFSGDLAKVRTGRASLSMFEGVKVDYYGSPTPINQVAGIANPEPNLITIQPWEQSILGDVEKSILAANLGLTPNNDGSIIRISIPPLTEERRKEYVKQVHNLAEDARVKIRSIRRDANDQIKKLEKDKDISEDDMHRGFDEVQKITDQEIKAIDELAETKEKEILSF